MQENWWGWLAVVVFFVIVQAWRALVRSTKSTDTGMARLNAAAERILKERQGGSPKSNPIPRTKGAAAKPMRSPTAANPKPRSAAPLPRSTTPAVIRRSGIFGGREPVIQRRR